MKMAEKPKEILVIPILKNFTGQFVLIAVVLGIVSFLFLGIARHIGFLLPGGVVLASLMTIIILLIVILSVLFPITENLFTQQLLVSEEEIIFKKGFITKKQVMMPRHFIFSVEITQTPYQSFVKTADISILSGGYASIEFKGALLEDAEKIKREIHCVSGK
ncbi:MAG: PH domain-containing protein [Clostridia bacterium]|nr:PH domain-containing protein [Clostridia bacterium]